MLRLLVILFQPIHHLDNFHYLATHLGRHIIYHFCFRKILFEAYRFTILITLILRKRDGFHCRIGE